jgi:hypothetical protein
MSSSSKAFSAAPPPPPPSRAAAVASRAAASASRKTALAAQRLFERGFKRVKKLCESNTAGWSDRRCKDHSRTVLIEAYAVVGAAAAGETDGERVGAMFALHGVLLALHDYGGGIESYSWHYSSEEERDFCEVAVAVVRRLPLDALACGAGATFLAETAVFAEAAAADAAACGGASPGSFADVIHALKQAQTDLARHAAGAAASAAAAGGAAAAGAGADDAPPLAAPPAKRRRRAPDAG